MTHATVADCANACVWQAPSLAVIQDGNMTHDLSVRAMGRDDLDGVRHVLDTTGLFAATMLDEMAEPFLSGAALHVWLVATSENAVIGFAYCEPERMTDGTFNLLAIAVAAERQRGGVGEALVRYLKGVLRANNARLLLVETSTDPDQEGARSFYLKDGFVEEARLRDFYAAGQTKVVFWKQL